MTTRSPRTLIRWCLAGGLALAAAAVLPAWTGPEPTPSPEPAAAAQPAKAEFPDKWFFTDRKTGKRYAAPQSLEGRAVPRLHAKEWIGKRHEMKDLKGKVVVIDFWATWCGPCMASIPKNTKMVDHYKSRGLVFLGIHDARRGFERMPVVAKSKKINYSLAIDDGGKSTKAFKVQFWPTYVVVDHKGIVRAAGLSPNHVEDVVKRLIEEKEQADRDASSR